MYNGHRRRTRGCSRCTCTPTFTQSPKIYSIGWKFPEIPCPRPVHSAPALFRALRRQWKYLNLECGITLIQIFWHFRMPKWPTLFTHFTSLCTEMCLVSIFLLYYYLNGETLESFISERQHTYLFLEIEKWYDSSNF